ncbi:ATP-grasp domain-containing protein [Streptomyces sp. NPDC059696]|uniref:ATP-grasp domain-containing protein n=1 Tax=Streptomyces sp. NPDC059696 TaxID=3346911 RepID=UPI0036D10D0B
MKRVLLINTTKQTAARMLQERSDIQLSVITDPRFRHFYTGDTDLELVTNVLDVSEVRLAALRIRQRNPFTHVVAPAELNVPTGGYIRSHFGVRGAGFDMANAFTNKYVMKQRLHEAGIPVADFRLLGDLTEVTRAARHLGWPVVVKPVLGGGAEDVFVLRDERETAELAASERSRGLREWPYPLLAEEYVDIREEFHCDAVVRQGEVVFAAVAKYAAPVLGSVGDYIASYTLPDEHPQALLVKELHSAAVQALGLRDGVTHLEVLKSADRHLVGEIACRPGGGGIAEQMLHQYGVDLWHEFLAASLEEPSAVTAKPATDYLAQFMLPRPNGRIEAISTNEELLRCPGAVHADVRASVGEVSHRVINSAAHAGVVLLRGDTEAQIRERMHLLREAYEITLGEATS